MHFRYNQIVREDPDRAEAPNVNGKTYQEAFSELQDEWTSLQKEYDGFLQAYSDNEQFFNELNQLKSDSEKIDKFRHWQKTHRDEEFTESKLEVSDLVEDACFDVAIDTVDAHSEILKSDLASFEAAGVNSVNSFIDKLEPVIDDSVKNMTSECATLISQSDADFTQQHDMTAKSPEQIQAQLNLMHNDLVNMREWYANFVQEIKSDLFTETDFAHLYIEQMKIDAKIQVVEKAQELVKNNPQLIGAAKQEASNEQVGAKKADSKPNPLQRFLSRALHRSSRSASTTPQSSPKMERRRKSSAGILRKKSKSDEKAPASATSAAPSRANKSNSNNPAVEGMQRAFEEMKSKQKATPDPGKPEYPEDNSQNKLGLG